MYPREISIEDIDNDIELSQIGLPRNFHNVLIKRAVIDFKESRDKPIPLTQSEQVYQ